MNQQVKQWLSMAGIGILAIVALLIAIQVVQWLFGEAQGWAIVLLIGISIALVVGILQLTSNIFDGRVHIFHALAFFYAFVMTGLGVYALVQQFKGEAITSPDNASPVVETLVDVLLRNPIIALTLIFSSLFLGLLSEIAGGLHYHFRELEKISRRSESRLDYSRFIDSP